MSKNFNKSVNNNYPKPERERDATEETDLSGAIGREYRQLAENAQQKAYELRDVAVDRVRSNPLGASAAIFAVGLILGALLRK